MGFGGAWGTCDCNVFALEALDAAYDTALAALIRGRYKTQAGAVRYRRRSRWGSFIRLVEEAGFAAGKRGFEQTGDLLVVAEPGKWEMVHIYLGDRVVSAFPREGVHYGFMADIRVKTYNVWRRPCPPQL